MPTAPKKTKLSASQKHADGPLDADEQNQAAEHASIRALVIHEVLRAEGEEELKRRPAALAWSGFAAGLSMGFSFLSLALIQSGLPPAPWARLVDSFGYTIGFMVVILGRQALFTESTLTAALPILVRRDRRTLVLTLRFWVIVLSCNLLGTLLFAALISVPGIFPAPIVASLNATAADAIGGAFWPTLVKAVLAGWLIALMVWLLPSARTAKILVIMILTYIVGVGRFSHIVAGSVDSAFAVFSGIAPVSRYFLGFLIPTLLGNILGGAGMVALLNHVPLAPDLEGSEPTAPIEE
jgi:formate/nitrite transporter FocA (FNT family)